MEFSAAILFLLACLGAMKSFSLIHEGSPRTTVCINLSAVLLLLSTLTHERYLLASFGFWAIFLFKETRPDNSHSYARLFLLIPLLHVFFKGIILGLSPLAGGGESSFQDVIGFWILHHFGDALLGLGGYYSGTGKFYSDWPLGKLGEQSDLRLLGFSMILIPLVLITISCLLKTRSDEYNNNGKSLKITFLFMMLVLTTLPSATVVQRIEFRWLFIPQALLLLLFTTCVSKYLINSRLKIPALLLPLLCFALISLHYRGDSKSFTLLRDQPSMLISSLEKVAPRQGYWILSLQQSDVTMPTYWQLGYGGVFTQMKNPPYLLVAKPDDCAAINANLPCISVFIRGASTNFEISKY